MHQFAPGAIVGQRVLRHWKRGLKTGARIWQGVVARFSKTSTITRTRVRLRSLGRKMSTAWPVQLATKAISFFSRVMPKGLYPRALMIIIAPIVILESVVAFIFMERHWQSVTSRLSEATARDVAAVTELYKSHSGKDDYSDLLDLARDRLKLQLRILPAGPLPPIRPKPFFALLDRTLSNEIRKQIKHPFWIDTIGNSRFVEIRIKLDKAVLGFITRRNQTYASNSHIFLLWMVGSSVVLVLIAIMFLRNQIKPIVRLASAANAFGKGQQLSEPFKPRGAREVRQAAEAFIDMQGRISAHVEQRTTMLAGVSHDLRTILTRFKLAVALMPAGEERDEMANDIAEMQHMLEEYLAFAQGDGGEEAAPVDVAELLQEVIKDATHFGTPIDLKMRERRHPLVVPMKRAAFKRTLMNLVSNATRFGSQVQIRAVTEDENILRIDVEDNGPGVPPRYREDVFKPFFRLDTSRNQDEGNSGLGLAIARDVAHSHGGDIELSDSELGGLKAVIRIPI